jgi:hypothetical protein
MQTVRQKWLYLSAFLLGMAVWIAVSALSGRREAWDSAWYFSAGMPILCAGSMILAFCEPARSWRWGVVPFAGQLVLVLISQGPGNLLPLGIVVFGIFSLPAILAARAGAFLANKWAAAPGPS